MPLRKTHTYYLAPRMFKSEPPTKHPFENKALECNRLSGSNIHQLSSTPSNKMEQKGDHLLGPLPDLDQEGETKGQIQSIRLGGDSPQASPKKKPSKLDVIQTSILFVCDPLERE